MAPLIPIALQLAAQFAPSIIGKLTGSANAENVAAHVVGIAQTITGTATPEAAFEAIKADPAKVLEFQLALAQNEKEIELAYFGDIQDARARDVEIVKTTGRNMRGNVLVAWAAFIVLACLLVVVWRVDMDDYVKATISLILGRALGWVEQVMSFEFGLTRESAKKDDTIKNLTK